MIVHKGTRHAEMMGGVPCFRCSEVVEAPLVFWFGTGADGEPANVVFHPMCASRFGAEFMGEVHDLEE